MSGTLGVLAGRVAALALPAAAKAIRGADADMDEALRKCIERSVESALRRIGGNAEIASVIMQPFLASAVPLELALPTGSEVFDLDVALVQWQLGMSDYLAAHPFFDPEQIEISNFAIAFSEEFWRELQLQAAKFNNPLSNLSISVKLDSIASSIAQGQLRMGMVTGPLHNLSTVVSTPAFLGRADELLAIDGLMKGGSTVVLKGPPAVGKSEIALRWVQKMPALVRWWVNCQTPQLMKSSLSELATLLGIAVQEDPFALIERLTLAHSDMILVFDGVTSRRDLRRLQELAHPAEAKLLITSPVVSSIVSPNHLVVEPLSHDQSTALLARLLPDQADADVVLLANYLVGQPLAIAQAAAYIESTGCGIATYRRLLSSNHQKMLDRGLEPGERTMAQVWNESIQLAEQLAGSNIVVALCVLKLLGAQQVRGDFWAASIAYAIGTADELGDEVSVRDAIGALTTLSLVSPFMGRYKSHSLLLDYVWSLAPNEVRAESVRSVLVASRTVLATSRSLGLKDGVEVFSCVRSIGAAHPDLVEDTLMGEVLTQAAALALQHDLFDSALGLSEVALVMLGTPAAEDQKYVRLLCGAASARGDALLGLHKYKEAALLATTLIAELAVVVDPTSAAVIHNFAARTAWSSGEVNQSLEHAERAAEKIGTLEVLTDDSRSLLSEALFLAGRASLSLGDEESGVLRLNEAIETISADPKLAVSGHAIRASAAQAFFCHGLPVPESLLLGGIDDEEHESKGGIPMPVASRSSVLLSAEVLADLGGQQQAEKRLRNLLETEFIGDSEAERILKAEATQHLARALISAERFSEAESLLRPALEVLRNLLSGRKVMSGVLVNLAVICMAKEEFDEAWILTSEALKIDKEEFGENHGEYANDAFVLAQVLMFKDQFPAARKWFLKAEKIFASPGPFRNEPKRLEVQEMLGLMESLPNNNKSSATNERNLGRRIKHSL